jgi:hypothetical protein
MIIKRANEAVLWATTGLKDGKVVGISQTREGANKDAEICNAHPERDVSLARQRYYVIPLYTHPPQGDLVLYSVVFITWFILGLGLAAIFEKLFL